MKRPKCKAPTTPEEWQEAVNGARFFLHLDSCRQYGLVDGGPGVNLDRCEELLERGQKLGYHPRPMSELVEMFVEKP